MGRRIIAVAKIGENVLTATDPNDFIFHSDYNTFKIILEGTKTVTLLASTSDQLFTQAHGLSFIPLVAAFARRAGDTSMFAPNGIDVELWGPKLGAIGDVRFNYISADATNITFSFSNAGSQIDVSIKYYCLEGV